MVKNSPPGQNKRNRTSSLSHVVVVKKKKFNIKKHDDVEKSQEESLTKSQDSVNNVVEEVAQVEPRFEHTSHQIESDDSKIRNLDDDFYVPKGDIEKQSSSRKNQQKKQDYKKEDYLEEVGADIIEKKQEGALKKDEVVAKKNNKDFLSDITIVSHSKEKKYNSASESSVFLNKPKYDDGGKKKKNFYDDAEVEKDRLRSIASIKRAREKAKRSLGGGFEAKAEEKKVKEIIIPEIITVQELANRMAVRSADVVKELMKMGMMITATKPIDADTAELLVTEFGHTPKRVLESDIENILDNDEESDESKKVGRFPVVSVMGHVDHGKTSLLDALRETDIVSSESGGITQHIGASVIKVSDEQSVTFLDTPGHEAFTAMRLRGAHATDMVILVVAADDGVKAQTIEAINHAKAANIPIIVAINKIDKEGSNPSRVVNELLEHEVVVESLGGECLCVEVSAVKKQNLDKVIDAIFLQSELLDLKANRDCSATGVVIESKVDKARGAVSSLLVQAGTLKMGDIVIAGSAYGRVKLMVNDKGQNLQKLRPSEPAEILGLDNAPEAGEKFHVVESEKAARDIIEYRVKKQRDIHAARKSKKTLEDIFSHMTDEKKVQLPLIVKADVKGSVEAINEALDKLSNESVKIHIIHSAVGGISESDVVLAQASNAVIIGFNVRTNNNVKDADLKDIDIRYFSIIYDVIDSVEAITHGYLKPIEKEVEIGKGEIRQVFNISKAGKVAGSYVLSGLVKRDGKCRIIRDSVVVSDTSIKALKRYKDDVKEVNTGSECGLTFENYTDFKEGDRLEFYEIIEEKRTK